MDQRIEYVHAVWNAFQQKNGIHRQMSNVEWCLAREWATGEGAPGVFDRDQVPLRVVIRAIEDFTGRPRRLEAMADPVRRAYAYWRQATSQL